MPTTTREVLETLAKVLLRCWIIGFILQFMLLGAVLGASEMIQDLHAALFGLSSHESGMITADYASMLKLTVGVFFFIPWLAILLVLRTKND